MFATTLESPWDTSVKSKIPTKRLTPFRLCRGCSRTCRYGKDGARDVLSPRQRCVARHQIGTRFGAGSRVGRANGRYQQKSRPVARAALFLWLVLLLIPE